MISNIHKLTEKQKEAIAPLLNSEKSYIRKINELDRQIVGELGMDFDKSKRLHNKKKDLETKLDDVSKKIEVIANAKESCLKHFEAGKKHIKYAKYLADKYEL